MALITNINPLVRLLDRTATDRFELIVSEGVPGSPVTNVATLFRGWITGANFTGPWIEADATGFGSLFSRKIPRTLLQALDNYALFDAGNRLLKANWTFSAQLTAVAGNVLTFDTLSWPGGALPAIADNYFALGYVERPSPLERIPIVSSTLLAAGSLTVTLAHAPATGALSPPESGWSLVPGYDAQVGTANTKFNNLENFGGFWEVPATDPSLVAVNNPLTGASKK